MRLTILGSGTSVASKIRKSPGYLLEINGTLNLLDCGPGIIHQLAHTQYIIQDISNIFVSHVHLDHVNELFMLFFSNRYHVLKNKTRKTFKVFSSEYNIKFLLNVEKFYRKWIYDPVNKYIFVPLKNMYIVDFEGFKVVTLSTYHTEGSLMFKFILGNKVFLYAGDTGLCQNLIDFSQNVDYLLIECSLPSEYKVDTHMDPKKLFQLIERSSPKNVILTHFYPEMDEHIEEIEQLRLKARNVGTNVIVSKDLMKVDIL